MIEKFDDIVADYKYSIERLRVINPFYLLGAGMVVGWIIPPVITLALLMVVAGYVGISCIKQQADS